MANQIGELLVKLGVDVTGLTEGLSGAIGALDSTGKAATRTGNVIAKAFDNLGVSDASAKVATSMQKVQNSFLLVEKAYQQGAVTAADYAKAQAGVRVELEKLSGAAKPAAVDMARLSDAMKSSGSVLTAALTVPIAGIGLAAGKMATDFELAMRKVTSLMGDDAAKSFKPLSDGVLELSKRLGIDAVGAAKALYEAISAGIPANNAISFLEVASKAAIAGVTDTKVAVDGMTTVLNAYNLKTEEAGKVADVMFQAVNIGKFTFEQLASSIGKAAGTAADLKVSYQELMAAAATITKQGFSVAEAMTMQESAMKALIVPHKAMIALIEKTGFASGALLVQSKGLEGALQAISTAAGGSIEKLAVAYGRIEGLKASLALTGRNAKMAADDLNSVANGSAGAAGKAFDEINKSFARQLQTFETRLKDLGIVLGTALLPIGQDLLKSFAPVLDAIGTMVTAFIKLPMPVKEAAVALAALAASAGPALYAIGGIGAGVTTMSAAVPVLTSALTAMGVTLATLTAAAAGVASLVVAFHELGSAWENVGKLASEIGFANVTKDIDALAASIEKVQATGLDAVFARMASEWKTVTDGLSNIDWWHVLSGPLGALNLGIEKALEVIHTLRGQFPEMDSAVKASAASMQKLVTAHDQVSESSLKVAAAMRGMGEINSTASDAMAKVAGKTADLAGELKAAEKDLALVKKAYSLHLATTADVAAATSLVQQAFAKLHPELEATGVAFGHTGKAAKAAAKEISDSFKELGITNSTLQIAEGTKKLNAAYAEQLKLYQAGKITSTDLANAYAHLRDELAKLNGIKPDFADKWNAQMHKLDEESSRIALKLEEDFGKAHAAIVAKSLKPIEINWQVHMPADIQDALKTASEQAQKLDNALKLAGVSQENLGAKAKALAEAYKLVQEAVTSGAATQMQADEVHQKALIAQIANQKSLGEDTKATEKELEALNATLAEHGLKVKGMKDTWNSFSNEVSTVVTNFVQSVSKALFDGTKDWGEKFKTLWKGLAEAVTSTFLTPVTKALTTFFTDTLAGLLKGGGIQSIKDAFIDLGKTVSSVFGTAGSAAKSVKAVGAAIGTNPKTLADIPRASGTNFASPFGGKNGITLDNSAYVGSGEAAQISGGLDISNGVQGDISEAGYDPGFAGTAETGTGILGSISGLIPLIGIAVSALQGIVQGAQMAHLIATAGKIETNTREMSVVMWQTGAESLQGLAKASLNAQIALGDRMAEVRDSIFDPLNTTLEGIWNTLKTSIYKAIVSSGRGSGGGSGDGNEVPLTDGGGTIQSYQHPSTILTSGFLSAVMEYRGASNNPYTANNEKNPFDGTEILGGIGSTVQAVGEAFKGFADSATSALDSFTLAAKGATASIATVAAGFTDGMSVLGSDLIPRITYGPVSSPSFGTGGPSIVVNSHNYIDGALLSNSIVNRLELQGVRL